MGFNGFNQKKCTERNCFKAHQIIGQPLHPQDGQLHPCSFLNYHFMEFGIPSAGKKPNGHWLKLLLKAISSTVIQELPPEFLEFYSSQYGGFHHVGTQ